MHDSANALPTRNVTMERKRLLHSHLDCGYISPTQRGKCLCSLRYLDLGCTSRGVDFVVLETIEILVPFAAIVASERFVLLHTKSARVRIQGFWVDNGKRPVFISCEFLRIMAVLRWISGAIGRLALGQAYGFVVFETIVVFVSFLATDDRAVKWLRWALA